MTGNDVMDRMKYVGGHIPGLGRAVELADHGFIQTADDLAADLRQSVFEEAEAAAHRGSGST
jgi:hypothetical protein